MRAAVYTAQGAADQVLRIVDLPDPKPGHGEVRVHVHTSGVNPADWKARSGARGDRMSYPQIIPHHDGAGIIDVIGPGVPDRVGERVWIWNGQWRRPQGTAADYVVLPARQAVRLPNHVSFEQGACLGIPAMTAVQAVRLSQPQQGDTVLVAGGSGAVSHVVIQLLKLAGARVLATVSTAEKAVRAREAGVDEIIDRIGENVGERVTSLTAGRGADIAIELDLAANATYYPCALRPHSTVVIYGTSAANATVPAHWLMRNSVRLLPFLVFDLSVIDRSACIRNLGKLLADDALRCDVATVMPLERIAKAHMLGEEGRQAGNIVLAMTEQANHVFP